MTDVDPALELICRSVLKRNLSDPDDARVRCLRNLLCQGRLSAARLADEQACAVRDWAALDRGTIVHARERRKLGDLRADINHELLAGPMQNFPVALIIGMVAKIEFAAKLREQARVEGRQTVLRGKRPSRKPPAGR